MSLEKSALTEQYYRMIDIHMVELNRGVSFL
mgnify:CR=1 FL=1